MSKVNQVVNFVHIPKTGGQTLHKIIMRKFTPQEIYYFEHFFNYKKYIDEFINTSKKDNKFKYIKGHVGFGLHNKLDRNFTYVTILRNPVKRTISHYNYILNHLRNTNKYKKIKNKTIYEYVSDYNLNNIQTRFLASNDGFPIMKEDKEYIGIKELKRAKNNLKENFDFVGILEKFNKGLLLLKEVLNLKDIQYVKWNKTKNKTQKKSVSRSINQFIKEKNQIDFKLYGFACKLFEERIKEDIDNFEDKYKKLKHKLLTKNYNYRENYTKRGKEILNKINQILKQNKDKKILIYGAGDHSRRLFKDTKIEKENIIGLVDKYKAGENFQGYEIGQPVQIIDLKPDIIIISSFKYQDDIYNLIKNDLKYKGRVIKLYSSEDRAPFYA